MAEHTPIPWQIVDDWVYSTREGGEPDLTVAEAPRSQAYLRDRNLTKEQKAANAAHIVRCVNAFPEMVDALTSARTHLITLGGDTRGMEGGDEIQAAVLDLVDAALARAKQP